MTPDENTAAMASMKDKRGSKNRLLRAMSVGQKLGLMAAAFYFIKVDFKISGEFTILPIHNADIRAEVEGIIEEIVRDEGDVVNAGDLIARLSDRDYRAEVEKVKAEIAEAVNFALASPYPKPETAAQGTFA